MEWTGAGKAKERVMEQQRRRVVISKQANIYELGTRREFVAQKVLSGELIQEKCGYIYYRCGNFSYRVPRAEASVS